MPRITPGITSGASISIDSAVLPRNRARSRRNALAAPNAIDSAVTQHATMALIPTLLSSGASPNSPIRPPLLPTNQFKVNPRHGGAG